MLHSDAPLAIPLWINGHAYLTMAEAFHDVVSSRTAAVLRRTPLCGAREARQAADAARAAGAGWAARSAVERSALLNALGDALAGYGAHFAALIAEESGNDVEMANAEVAQAVALLRAASAGKAANSAEVVSIVGNTDGVASVGNAKLVAIAGNADGPLLAPLRLAVGALQTGAVVIVTPSPQTPSALFALAELSARCAFPNGVLSIVHGREAVLDGLRAAGVCVLQAEPAAL